jgi:hypothetical protein
VAPVVITRSQASPNSKLRNARAKYAHTEGEIKTNMAKQG